MDGARFCRACGADISLVPQAMTGHLAQAQAAESDALDQPGGSARRRRRHRRDSQPTLDKAIKNVFIGVAFMLVSVASFIFAPGGRHWWFWFLIPAFTMLGGGIAELIRLRHERSHMLPSGQAQASVAPSPSRAGELSPLNTSELMPQPPSVTEGTTRHLGSEGPTEYLGAPRGQSNKNV
jgi:hypothetical protein